MATPHGTQTLPNQGCKRCPLQWKLGVLTTGPPGKSQESVSIKLLGSLCPLAPKRAQLRGNMESDESPRCPQTWQDHPGWVLLPHAWGVQSLNLINAASDAHIRALVKWCVQSIVQGLVYSWGSMCVLPPCPRQKWVPLWQGWQKAQMHCWRHPWGHNPKVLLGPGRYQEQRRLSWETLTLHRETAFLVSLYYVGNMQKNFFFNVDHS